MPDLTGRRSRMAIPNALKWEMQTKKGNAHGVSDREEEQGCVISLRKKKKKKKEEAFNEIWLMMPGEGK